MSDPKEPYDDSNQGRKHWAASAAVNRAVLKRAAWWLVPLFVALLVGAVWSVA